MFLKETEGSTYSTCTMYIVHIEKAGLVYNGGGGRGGGGRHSYGITVNPPSPKNTGNSVPERQRKYTRQKG